MKNYFRGVAVLLIGMLLWFPVGTRPTQAQSGEVLAIDVFLWHDRTTEEVQVYFANPITGLSTLVTLSGFPPTLNPLDEFALTANGVIFRDPAGGRPRLISPTGGIFNLDFVPQSPTLLHRIDWVLSPDRRTLAWAEISFDELGWRAQLYIANLDGSNFRALPMLDILPVQATRRVDMVGVSNNAVRIFFDAEHLPTRPPDTPFEGFARVRGYTEAIQAYFDLPGEPTCDCPARITQNGQSFLRLRPSASGAGFDLYATNLENNAQIVVGSPIDAGYTHAGYLTTNTDATWAIYSTASIEADGEMAYGLVSADILARRQIILIRGNEGLLQPRAFIDGDSAVIVVNVETQETYKLDLNTGALILVSNKMWLGTIRG
jgi:hypothetical protein